MNYNHIKEFQKKTFTFEGKSFNGKAIIALAKSRGISDGTFYKRISKTNMTIEEILTPPRPYTRKSPKIKVYISKEIQQARNLKQVLELEKTVKVRVPDTRNSFAWDKSSIFPYKGVDYTYREFFQLGRSKGIDAGVLSNRIFRSNFTTDRILDTTLLKIEIQNTIEQIQTNQTTPVASIKTTTPVASVESITIPIQFTSSEYIFLLKNKNDSIHKNDSDEIYIRRMLGFLPVYLLNISNLEEIDFASEADVLQFLEVRDTKLFHIFKSKEERITKLDKIKNTIQNILSQEN